MIRLLSAVVCALVLLGSPAQGQEPREGIIEAPDLSEFEAGDPDHLLNERMRARLDAMVGLGTRLLPETLNVAPER